MTSQHQTRRRFLGNGLALGCSLAASPIMTPVTFANAPLENRLVVIILRGGMDGLDAIQPYGAPEFDGLRFTKASALGDLDGFFGLHPALSGLMPLWRAGDLGFVHAVSTPYRDKRSHFDGQDILEAGIGLSAQGRIRDGWLNRMLQHVPGVEIETAYAVGRSDMLLTRGKAKIADWSPDASLALTPQAERLLEQVMHDDPLFRDAALEAIALSMADLSAEDIETSGGMADMGGMMSGMQKSAKSVRKGAKPDAIAKFAAERLRGDTRIAAFSLSGFDTHASQRAGLPKALDQLQSAILTLKATLGPVWDKTAVVAMTEFGRTMHLNGSGGTDHGTAGAMVLAGGAINGGRVVTEWPGLEEADLYKRRDLMPTRDIRAHTGWILRQHFGFDRHLVESVVFPDLDMGSNPGLIL